MAVSGKKHGKGKDRPVIGAPSWLSVVRSTVKARTDL